MTATEKRALIAKKYKEILGRNIYSQNLRNYCFKPYHDGKYYSDCSSSISWTYREAGFDFGILNTVGMIQSTKFVDVPVEIKKGIIQNPEVLRIGDMLLFAGSDSSRAYAEYVGHVEMVYAISGIKVTLAGHGSGNPSTKDMSSYCKTRYNRKTSTKLGHSGLIRVRRFILDDGTEDPTTTTTTTMNLTLGCRLLKNGCVGADVKELQNALIQLGYDCGRWGADGEFGDATELAVVSFQRKHALEQDGEYGPKTHEALTMELERDNNPTGSTIVRIIGGNCYVRSEPTTDAAKIGVAYCNETLPYQGETNQAGWHKIRYAHLTGWVSGKYGKIGG